MNASAYEMPLAPKPAVWGTLVDGVGLSQPTAGFDNQLHLIQTMPPSVHADEGGSALGCGSVGLVTAPVAPTSTAVSNASLLDGYHYTPQKGSMMKTT
jgi:hypothetical protein